MLKMDAITQRHDHEFVLLFLGERMARYRQLTVTS
jgi:hypothetical protein